MITGYARRTPEQKSTAYNATWTGDPANVLYRTNRPAPTQGMDSDMLRFNVLQAGGNPATVFPNRFAPQQWQQPLGQAGLTDIENKYGGLNPVRGTATFGASSVSPLAALRGPNPTGELQGPPAPMLMGLPGIGNTPNTPGVSFQPSTDASVVPKSNTVQRWQDAGNPTQPAANGVKPMTDQRRYFWATGSVDARAPQANPAANLGAPAPVTFNPSPGHSDWQPY